MPYRIAASIVRRAHGVQAAPQNQNEPELNDAMCEHGSVDFLFFCPVRFPLQPQNRCFWDSPASAAASRRSTSQKKTGAFKRNGLHVDFLVLQGGSQALQVLFVRRNKIDQRKTCVESTPSYG